jgi:hypothetical protein
MILSNPRSGSFATPEKTSSQALRPNSPAAFSAISANPCCTLTRTRPLRPTREADESETRLGKLENESTLSISIHMSNEVQVAHINTQVEALSLYSCILVHISHICVMFACISLQNMFHIPKNKTNIEIARPSLFLLGRKLVLGGVHFIP